MMKEKITLFLFTILTSTNLLTAQNTETQKIFSNAQGIKQEKTTFYEVEGYSIFVLVQQSNFDDKGIKKIKRKYSIKSDVVPNVDTTLPTNKIFVSTENKTDKVIQSNIYYIFPEGQNGIKVIGLHTIT